MTTTGNHAEHPPRGNGKPTPAGLITMLCAGLLLAITAYGVRYEPPPLGRLAFDAVLDPATRAELPLRLPRTGRYYAELILEAPVDGSAFLPDIARAFTFDVRFFRRDRELHRESTEVTFTAGERSKTLFWLDAPGMVPDRAALRMQVLMTPATRDALRGTALRLQVTRKAEFLPFAPR